MGNPIDGVKKWLFKVALAKAAKRAIPWLASMAVMFIVKANGILGGAGVEISIDEAALTAAIAGALTVAQNWVKVKFNISWL